MATAFAAGFVAVALPGVALLLANRSTPLARSNPVEERWDKDWFPRPRDLERLRARLAKRLVDTLGKAWRRFNGDEGCQSARINSTIRRRNSGGYGGVISA
jgi:hypothetical protein